jgi:RNA polymerase sporulation-specific sigma factor
LIIEELVKKAKVEMDDETFELILKKIMRNRFFHKLVNQYYIPGHDHQDNKQIAMMAVLEAIKCYDEEAGKFIPYCYHVVKGSLIAELKRETVSNKRKLLNKSEMYESPLQHSETTLMDAYERNFKAMGHEDIAFSDPSVVLDTSQTIEEINIKLTRKEKMVMELQIQGYDYTEIAKILGINHKAVDNTVQRIRKKARSQKCPLMS